MRIWKTTVMSMSTVITAFFLGATLGALVIALVVSLRNAD